MKQAKVFLNNALAGAKATNAMLPSQMVGPSMHHSYGLADSRHLG